MDISHSRLACYKACPYAHKLRYFERLEPNGVQKPLYKGSAIHRLLEARELHLIDPNNPTWQEVLEQELTPKYNELSDTDKEALGDFPEDARKIMNQYDWCYANENVKYLEVEKEFKFQLVRSRKHDPVNLIGYVDAVVELAGKQYIVEHKTYSRDPMTLQDAWINIQTSIYAYALNKKFGYHIEGIIWDMIKSEPYSEPNILKNGSYGKQTGKVTLMSFKENPGEDIIEQVKDNHLNFLQRFVTPLVPNAIDLFMKDTLVLARMLHFKGEKMPSYKRLSRDCGWCSFKDICQTELTGGDVNYIKETLYHVREERKQNVLPESSEATE